MNNKWWASTICAIYNHKFVSTINNKKVCSRCGMTYWG